MLVAVIAGAAIVIAVALLSGSSLAAVAVGFVLVAAAALKLWRDYRQWSANRRLDRAGGA